MDTKLASRQDNEVSQSTFVVAGNEVTGPPSPRPTKPTKPPKLTKLTKPRKPAGPPIRSNHRPVFEKHNPIVEGMRVLEPEFLKLQVVVEKLHPSADHHRI